MSLVNLWTRYYVYSWTPIQEFAIPAGYFYDPLQKDAYLNVSTFLPLLNNEIFHDKFKPNRNKFAQLELLFCVMYSEEDKYYPKESCHFYEPIQND